MPSLFRIQPLPEDDGSNFNLARSREATGVVYRRERDSSGEEILVRQEKDSLPEYSDINDLPTNYY